MCVRQNALNLAHRFPLAAKAVDESFYVDDCLTGAASISEAISLQQQLQELFIHGGFLLRKWNSSEPDVLRNIDLELRDSIEVLTISDSDNYTKTLGLEWNTSLDCFRLTISQLSPEITTKRSVVSNIAKIFDIFGWFSPTTIKMKILLQCLWEMKLDWDDEAPSSIQSTWSRWRNELTVLYDCHIPRYYFPKDVDIVRYQLHGFSDASEDAYAGVAYLRGEDNQGGIHVRLVMAKTKVSPLKRLTIPRLELCGSHLLAKVLHHLKDVYHIPPQHVYAWTDSTIVLSWLDGSPKRFKTFVGNRISAIIDLIPPECWNHVISSDNPADCASRGLYPSELLHHDLWWKGPKWLALPQSEWPKTIPLPVNEIHDEQKEVCVVSPVQTTTPVIPIERYSKFSRLLRVTAWIYRFVHSCCKGSPNSNPLHLSVSEISVAEKYWVRLAQRDAFPEELSLLQANTGMKLRRHSHLKLLNPYLDPDGIIRVGGRISRANLSYDRTHPIVLHGKHSITHMIITAEHHRMLHPGPSLLSASISLKFHIINLHRVVRKVTHECVTCKRYSGRVMSQQEGQLPLERITPDTVFEKVGIDYAGPFLIKRGHTRKPTIVKAYVCLFVSLTVKAVHLELVSDLTTEAFIATLRRFIGRRGLPTLIWSDHGTNFIGADRDIKDIYKFIEDRNNQGVISDFCGRQMIEWRFIPERAPHFGGLWESAVKSMKKHLRRITADVKFTFEEMTTILCQIEACLNSRPLITKHHVNDDIVEPLTPGHFLIGRPLTALPDRIEETRSISLSHRWQLCQNVVHHFWKRWSTEYLTQLNKYTKWPHYSRNISVGDIVILRDNTLFPTHWPLARVVKIHPGKDKLVRVITVKTAKGSYKRPITKVVLLVPSSPEQ
jgi:hypothetical protein